jgi:hypothetical protein
MQHLIATYLVAGLIVSVYLGWMAFRNITLSRRLRQLLTPAQRLSRWRCDVERN